VVWIAAADREFCHQRSQRDAGGSTRRNRRCSRRESEPLGGTAFAAEPGRHGKAKAVGEFRQEAMASRHQNTPDEIDTATAEKTELISKLEARVAQLEKTVDARDAKVSSLNSQLTLVKFELTQHEERTKRRESKLKQAVRTMLDDAKARAEEVNLWRQSAAWKLEEATMGKRFAALEEVYRLLDLDGNGTVEEDEMMLIGQAWTQLETSSADTSAADDSDSSTDSDSESKKKKRKKKKKSKKGSRGGGGGDGGGEWTRAMNVQLMRKIGVNHEGNIECDRFVDYYSNLLPQGPAEFDEAVGNFRMVARLRWQAQSERLHDAEKQIAELLEQLDFACESPRARR